MELYLPTESVKTTQGGRSRVFCCFFSSLTCNGENYTPPVTQRAWLAWYRTNRTLVACPAPCKENMCHFTATFHTPTSTPFAWLYEASSLVSICSEWQKHKRDQRCCGQRREGKETRAAEAGRTGQVGSWERVPGKQVI